MKRISLDETVSTNRYAKELPEDKSHELTLVTAEFQTAGRGAGTNTWESERSQNLLFSIIAYPRQLFTTQLFALSEVTALAIRDALCSIVKVQGSTIPSSFGGVGGGFNSQSSILNSQFFIKWPNDIYFGDKKAVGMLIENDLQGKQVHRSVIGVGVNINQTLFRSDAPNPISLAQILGHKENRCQVLEQIMEQFIHYYGMMEEAHYDELQHLYMQHLYRREALYSYADENGIFRAHIRGVEPSGHLVLQDEDNRIRRYAFKEVQFVI